MKLFGLGKGKSKESPAQMLRCSHPVSHQVPVHEDTEDPHRITGMKCTQCGQVLPIQKVA